MINLAHAVSKEENLTFRAEAIASLVNKALVHMTAVLRREQMAQQRKVDAQTTDHFAAK